MDENFNKDEACGKFKDNSQNLEESQVEFKIFIQAINKENNEKETDLFYQNMIDYIEQLSFNYIWNNQKFYLNKPIKLPINNQLISNDRSINYLCHGCIDFGDNFKDEWFIVYLLYKLSLKFSRKIAAKINDMDGEFLLIHSANFLPEWASKADNDNMKNRVFIFDGYLHLIPPASKPSEITYLPACGSIISSIYGAQIVFDFPSITKASNLIQECLFKQINIFEPDVINKNLLHKATCTIPAKLAWLIKNNPNLISYAINRFCEKDPNDLKLCSKFNIFKPEDLVDFRVLFTKHLYSKLKFSDYRPEKGHNWPSVIFNKESITSLIKERSVLGFKLTCAFEIISKEIKIDQLENKTVENFISKLKTFGYFKDSIENSKKYNELIEKAKENFENDKNEVKNNFENYKALIENFYLDKKLSENHVINLKEEITKVQKNESDDTDDWLCVEAPQLDDYLEMYSKGDVASGYDFNIVSNALKNFIQERGNKKENLLNGVEFKSIANKADEKLIDFNAYCVEEYLKDVLKITTKNFNKLGNQLENNDDNDDEKDSFFEVDDDMLENEIFEDDDSLRKYMSSMDAELTEEKNLSRIKNDELDIDLNLVSNALESYSSQLGLSGPVSNILKSLGL